MGFIHIHTDPGNLDVIRLRNVGILLLKINGRTKGKEYKGGRIGICFVFINSVMACFSGHCSWGIRRS